MSFKNTIDFKFLDFLDVDFYSKLNFECRLFHKFTHNSSGLAMWAIALYANGTHFYHIYLFN